MMTIRVAVPLIVAALLITGCTAGEDPGAVAATDPSTTAATPTPGPTATAEPDPTEPPVDDLGLEDGEYPSRSQVMDIGPVPLCDYAGEEFCTDSNDNVWPDFVEEELGLDPTVDGCAQTDCAAGDVDDFLDDATGNTLVILDASGSMAGDAGGGQTKMDAAKAAVVAHVAGTPDFVDVGLMVYGHRGDNSDAGRPESCAGIETFASIGAVDHTNVETLVTQFSATGWTPIAASLDAAGPLMVDAAAADDAEGIEGSHNRIILISDGLETCDGDPVASAAALASSGVEVVVDVVGFDIAEGDRDALAEVAAVTGGTYTDARSGGDLLAVMGEYNAQYADLVDRVNCQAAAMARMSNCAADLSRDAYQVLSDLVTSLDADGDTARARFLATWSIELDGLATERTREREATLSARLDELQAAVNESVRRQDEAFGRASGRQKVAVGEPAVHAARTSFVCPFTAGGHGTGLMA